MKTMTVVALGATAFLMAACSGAEPAANTEANLTENVSSEDLTAIDNGTDLSGNAADTTNSLEEAAPGNEADNATSNAL